MITPADQDASKEHGEPQETAIDSPRSAAEDDERGHLTLAPVLPARFALTLPHVAAAAFFALLFVLLNWLPLKPADLWGHVAYGHWILAHRALPLEDPFVPLFAGMRVVDTAWLSQVALAGADRLRGAEGLSTLFAVAGIATYLVLARCFFAQTGRVGLAVAGVACTIAVGLSRAITIRPEMFGSLAFAVLLWIVTTEGAGAGNDPAGRPPAAGRWRLWLGAPLLMALWANLHGSFVCGIALLGCCFLGRAIEVCWTRRSLAAAVRDGETRRWLWATELAAAATLVNPYGLDLWIETIRFTGNPNLREVLEWQPLEFLGLGGREFAATWVALTVLLRFSRRPMPVAHVLLLAVFGLATAARVRMLGWYAPIFVWVALPHAAELLARVWPLQRSEPLPAERPSSSGPTASDAIGELPPGRSWRYSLAFLAIVWVGFAFSPSSQPLLKGKGRTPAQRYGDTPLALADHLRAQPPQGQIFNPQRFGDWLVAAGPPGLKPFMVTNMHLAPRQVWVDYLRIFNAQPGWQAVLRRYDIDTLVVDRRDQLVLEPVLRRDVQGFRLAFEDDVSAVFVRIPTPAEAGQASPASQAEPATDAAAPDPQAPTAAP